MVLSPQKSYDSVAEVFTKKKIMNIIIIIICLDYTRDEDFDLISGVGFSSGMSTAGRVTSDIFASPFVLSLIWVLGYVVSVINGS